MNTFNNEQTRFVADFTKGLSLFFFGTALAPLFTKIDNIDYSVLVLGLVDGFLFLSCGIYLLKRKK